jgi:hypothetical protein
MPSSPNLPTESPPRASSCGDRYTGTNPSGIETKNEGRETVCCLHKLVFHKSGVDRTSPVGDNFEAKI